MTGKDLFSTSLLVYDTALIVLLNVYIIISDTHAKVYIIISDTRAT